MNSETILREQLVNLLKGGNAFMPFSEAVADFPHEHMNTTFPNGTYAPWDLLEHIRLTQWDILDFIRNQDYKEMSWPTDYWPPKDKKATKKEWDQTIKQFQNDLEELQKIAKNPKTDLYSKITWGDGQTILREILVVADHNAYHTGEFTIMRQAMKTWPKSHKS